MASIAQLDNDMRAARTRDEMAAALHDRRRVFKAPIGYRKPESRHHPSLVVDHDAAPFVKEAFERASLWNEPREHIRLDLVERGFATRSGKAVSRQSFNNMLKNHTYYGRMIVSKSIKFDGRGDFEALIDQALFEQVQERPRESSKRQLDNPDFPLRRFVRCGQCSTPLTASWSAGRSKRHANYHCRQSACKGIRIPKEKLESHFIRHLGALSANSSTMGLLLEIVRDECRTRSRAIERQANELTSKRERTESKKQKVLEAYLYQSAIDQTTYEREVARLDAELTDIADQEQRQRPLSLDELDRATSIAAELLSDLPGCWNRLDTAQRPGFLYLVHPDGMAYDDDGFGTADSPLFYLPSQPVDGHDASLVPPVGFEPTTNGLKVHCANQTAPRRRGDGSGQFGLSGPV